MQYFDWLIDKSELHPKLILLDVLVKSDCITSQLTFCSTWIKYPIRTLIDKRGEVITTVELPPPLCNYIHDTVIHSPIKLRYAQEKKQYS